MFFGRQVQRAISHYRLFGPQERILVALSGGKDSLALMLELKLQGYDVSGLHIDLGIPNSSEPARASVERFCAKHELSLQVIELTREGLPIPAVKDALKRPICSACGKIKRYFFNKAAMDGGYDALATGHNLDDEISRLFANVLRWDAAYLSDQGPSLPAANGFARRVKPLCRLSEFETANYCFLRGIDPHSSGCPFSHGATFTAHKALWADLEDKMPGQKLSFYECFLQRGRAAFARQEEEQGVELSPCPECGYPTSADLCGVCRIRRQVAG
jgi:uncharacterized protein (TIGR00269 family)